MTYPPPALPPFVMTTCSLYVPSATPTTEPGTTAALETAKPKVFQACASERPVLALLPLTVSTKRVGVGLTLVDTAGGLYMYAPRSTLAVLDRSARVISSAA